MRKAGLEVKVRQVPSAAKADELGNIAPHREKEHPEKERIDSLPLSAAPSPKKKKSHCGCCQTYLLFFLVILVVGASGYSWYWLYRPLPTRVLAAEQALFDGNLTIAGLIDIKKLTVLERYWFGELDPKALPLDIHQQGLLNKLLSGAPKFRKNLPHILYAASITPDKEQGTQLMLLAGKFKEKPLLKALGTFFHTEQVNKNRWQLTPLPPSGTNTPCAENAPETENKGLFLQIMPDWLMLATDSAYADHIWERFSSGHQAKQDLSVWKKYRKGKFINLMVINPAGAGKTIGGIPKLMAQDALTETPQVKEIALGLEIHPLKGGLNANLHLNSSDLGWNTFTVAGIQKKITELQQNTRSVTPTLAGILTRIKPSNGSEGLDIDVRVDSRLLHDLSRAWQEEASSLLFGISGGDIDSAGITEQINDEPTKYKNIALTKLPDYIGDKSQPEPSLFVNGPFAVDLKSVAPDDNGVLKLWLEGRVQLPKDISDLFNATGKISLQVDSVQDASGQELLRDEYCMGLDDLSGQSHNHEPETGNTHQQNQGWAWKRVRLQPNASVEQIHKITGEINLTLPTQIQKFPVPFRAGEAIEHSGVRFYLSSIKKDAVSYQASGNTARLIEIRGFNKAGQVLQQGWLMNDKNSGRTTQHFTGKVEALEIFIAESMFEQKTTFALTDLSLTKKHQPYQLESL